MEVLPDIPAEYEHHFSEADMAKLRAMLWMEMGLNPLPSSPDNADVNDVGVKLDGIWQHGSSKRRWHGVLLHPVDPTENLLGQACWDQGLLALAAEARALLQCMDASSSFAQLLRSSSLGVAYHDQVNRLEQLRAAGRV
jgi:hypothetical protein